MAKRVDLRLRLGNGRPPLVGLHRLSMSAMDSPVIAGIDFSSAPSRRKPIVIARLRRRPELEIEGFDQLETLAAFDQWLVTQPDWVAGCDFPFGLPRPFVDAQGWRGDWLEVTARIATLSRAELVDRCRAWCAARPVGDRFAHRRADRPAGSSPSMKWVNPPVVLMLHAGAPRLAAAGVDIPWLAPRRPAARCARSLSRSVRPRSARPAVLQERRSSPRRQRPPGGARGAGRGHGTGVDPARTSGADRCRDPTDAGGRSSADALDAVICAIQAAWAWERRAANYGIPTDIDPCEGWIVTAIESPMVVAPPGVAMAGALSGAPMVVEPSSVSMVVEPSSMSMAVEPSGVPLPSAARRRLVR